MRTDFDELHEIPGDDASSREDSPWRPRIMILEGKRTGVIDGKATMVMERLGRSAKQ